MSIASQPVPDGQDPDAVVIVQSNAPDTLLAKRIAHVLTEEHLVACAHVGVQGISMYEWNGELEGAEETPLTFKTTAGKIPALYQRLMQLHPYEVPEFLVLPVVGGSPEYLAWVRAQTAV